MPSRSRTRSHAIEKRRFHHHVAGRAATIRIVTGDNASHGCKNRRNTATQGDVTVYMPSHGRTRSHAIEKTPFSSSRGWTASHKPVVRSVIATCFRAASHKSVGRNAVSGLFRAASHDFSRITVHIQTTFRRKRWKMADLAMHSMAQRIHANARVGRNAKPAHIRIASHKSVGRNMISRRFRVPSHRRVVRNAIPEALRIASHGLVRFCPTQWHATRFKPRSAAQTSDPPT